MGKESIGKLSADEEKQISRFIMTFIKRNFTLIIYN